MSVSIYSYDEQGNEIHSINMSNYSWKNFMELIFSDFNQIDYVGFSDDKEFMESLHLRLLNLQERIQYNPSEFSTPRTEEKGDNRCTVITPEVSFERYLRYIENFKSLLIINSDKDNWRYCSKLEWY